MREGLVLLEILNEHRFFIIEAHALLRAGIIGAWPYQFRLALFLLYDHAFTGENASLVIAYEQLIYSSCKA